VTEIGADDDGESVVTG